MKIKDLKIPYTLDTKDCQIIAQLDMDARQSNNQIAKKLSLSKEVVKYRIDRLIKNRVILRFHTVINYFRVGIVKFKLYLRLTNANNLKIEEICNYFYTHTNTEWVVHTTGRWDIIVGFLVNNVNEFDDELLKLYGKFASHIQEKTVSITIYLAHQSREFLTNSSSPPIPSVVYHTTKDKQEIIDETDLHIIRLIVNNARLPITEIASTIKLTPRIVQYRIKELERKKIILAYKAHIDPKSIGRIFCKLIIYLSATTQTQVQSFIAFSSSLPGAVWPQRVLSDWDFELDLELESYDQFQDVILQLKEKFPNIIRNHEFCIVSKEFKLDFFPNCYRELH